MVLYYTVHTYIDDLVTSKTNLKLYCGGNAIIMFQFCMAYMLMPIHCVMHCCCF